MDFESVAQELLEDMDGANALRMKKTIAQALRLAQADAFKEAANAARLMSSTKNWMEGFMGASNYAGFLSKNLILKAAALLREAK